MLHCNIFHLLMWGAAGVNGRAELGSSAGQVYLGRHHERKMSIFTAASRGIDRTGVGVNLLLEDL